MSPALPPLGERFEVREVTAYCTYRVGASEPVAVSWNRADAENCRAMCERNEWPWYSRPMATQVGTPPAPLSPAVKSP